MNDSTTAIILLAVYVGITIGFAQTADLDKFTAMVWPIAVGEKIGEWASE